jgi:hypothetical protein
MWTYFTQNMPFQARMGEFFVLFVESRPGQYDLCDPTMGGIGAYPVYLRQALEIMQEAVILDPVTELGEDPTARPSDFISRAIETELPIGIGVVPEVAGGVALFPVDLAIRDLLFRPQEERLVAGIRAEVFLTPSDDDTEPVSWAREWGLSLTEAALTDLGAFKLRSAIAVPAPAGDYTARVRIADTTSGAAATWDGEVTVGDGGYDVGPLLIGPATVTISESDPVIASVGRDGAAIGNGEVAALLAWVRGPVPAAEEVALRLTSEGGEDTVIAVESLQVFEGTASILVLTTRFENVLAGRYRISLDTPSGTASTVIDVR